MHQRQQAARGEPSFILEDYFAGRIRAWGMFVDRFGGIRRQFSVDIRGDIKSDQLVLKEDFTFDDGERSQRIWRITPLGDGRYSGSADDVVGIAKGQVTGNRLCWPYDLNLTIGQWIWRVHLDDVMLLQKDRILLNRASMSKYGFALGEVIIFLQKDVATAEDGVLQSRPNERDAGRRTDKQGVVALAVPA